MKTFRSSAIAAIVLAVVSLAACKKNSSRPASATSQLAFQLQAVSSSSTLATTPASGTTTNSLAASSIAGLTWTGGIANISKFSFEAKRNGVSINIESRNLTGIDIFSPNPITTYVTLDTGIYKEIEVKVFLEPSADTSLLPLKLTGTFTNDSAKVVPIELDLNSDVTIKTELKNFDISGTTDYVALVQMQLDKLTKGVTAAALNGAKLTDGKIIISKSSNASIYWTIRSNLSESGHCEFREHHHHGDGD